VLIQNAWLTGAVALRDAAVRAVLALTGLGFLAAQWPGLFEVAEGDSLRPDRVWSAAFLGAVALAALVPIQRWDQVRSGSAFSTQSRAPGFPQAWIIGIWLGSIVVALGLPALAAAWLLIVSGTGSPSLVALVTILAAVIVTAAIASALSTILGRVPSLLVMASLWIIGAIASRARLPGGDVVTIILPPVRLLSFATRTQWAGSPEAHVGSMGLLAVLVTAAALAAAVGMARSRWN